MAQHNLFGQEAEQKALSFLCNKGYVLLEKIIVLVKRRLIC